MADEKEWQIEAIKRAVREYLEPVLDDSGEMAAFMLKRDIHMKWFHKAIHKGLYFFSKSEAQKKGDDAILYMLSKTLEPVEGEEGGFGFVMTPASFDYEKPKMTRKGPITLRELEIWATENMLTEEGDTERAKELILSSYRNKDGRLLSEIKDGEQLPKQDTNKPETHYHPNSKLSNTITKLDTNGVAWWLAMGGKKEPSVETRISLSYEDENGVELSKKMTRFDREVHDAVASLWAAGNRVIAPNQVFRIMAGSKSKVTPKQRQRVEESIDKQRRTFVTLDFSKELRGKTAEFEGETITASEANIEQYMLNADKQTVIGERGERVIGYAINKPPILYYHDKITGQIVSYKQSLLEKLSKEMGNTDSSVLIRNYLIQQVKVMGRKGSNRSSQILYETIYKEIDSEPKDRTERKRLNDKVKKCLDVLKGEGQIAGWSEYRDKGRSHKLKGVDIELPKDK